VASLIYQHTRQLPGKAGTAQEAVKNAICLPRQTVEPSQLFTVSSWNVTDENRIINYLFVEMTARVVRQK